MGPELITDEDWEGVSVIIVTHMYGCPAPVQDLVVEAKKRSIFVIEDCSQSFGAKVGDKYVGSFGDAAIFSFSLTDNFTTMGGGMAVFKDRNYAQKARDISSKAQLTPNASIYPLIFKSACMWLGGTSLGFMVGIYPYLAMGWSFLGKDLIHTIFSESISTTVPELNRRPSPAQAALGGRLIEEALEKNEKRRQYGIRLIELFEQENIPNISFTQEPAYGTSIFTSFLINYEAKEKLARQLSSRGVDASPGYISKAIHSEPVFSENVRYYGILPNSNYLARTQLHLPIYSSLQDRDLVRMVKKCRESVEYIEHYEAGETKYRSLPNADAPNLKNLPTPKKNIEEDPEKKRPMSAAINNPKLRTVANPPRLSIPQRKNVKPQDPSSRPDLDKQ
ncbi:DegT/DnrJ/EryC1/StrS family aminotransferase, partial [bacterium]|nr:DegT/DnrJ/EryC1/StrS family aminotransferase [bacterium]